MRWQDNGGRCIECYEFNGDPVRSAFAAAHIDGFAAGLVERVAINAGADGREGNRPAALRRREAGSTPCKPSATRSWPFQVGRRYKPGRQRG